MILLAITINLTPLHFQGLTPPCAKEFWSFCNFFISTTTSSQSAYTLPTHTGGGQQWTDELRSLPPVCVGFILKDTWKLLVKYEMYSERASGATVVTNRYRCQKEVQKSVPTDGSLRLASPQAGVGRVLMWPPLELVQPHSQEAFHPTKFTNKAIYIGCTQSLGAWSNTKEDQTLNQCSKNSLHNKLNLHLFFDIQCCSQ